MLSCSYFCKWFHSNNHEENLPLLSHSITIKADPELIEYFNRHSIVKYTHNLNTCSYYLLNEKSINTQIEILNQLTCLFNIENGTDHKFSLVKDFSLYD